MQAPFAPTTLQSLAMALIAATLATLLALPPTFAHDRPLPADEAALSHLLAVIGLAILIAGAVALFSLRDSLLQLVRAKRRGGTPGSR